MYRNFDCCLNCTERAMGCHSTCGAYISRKEENEKIKKAKAIAEDFNNFQYQMRNEARRRNKNRRRK